MITQDGHIPPVNTKTATESSREARYHSQTAKDDPRATFERDRDRVLYTDALRRLNGITQVVSPQGHTFHNRLTHTQEVAQIGRRIAQYIQASLEGDDKAHERRKLIDPDVVETACLAHDLGHPPFGHVAEEELDQLAKQHGGFEGNAQSFHIVTQLALHRKSHSGLDLTRATLNAILKYPWMRLGEKGDKTHDKFGAYEENQADFDFARQGFPEYDKAKPDQELRSLEAQVMDHADAIAYAVHDLDDFYKAGLLPMSYLAQRQGLQAFFEAHGDKFLPRAYQAEDRRDEALDLIWKALDIYPFDRPYDGSRDHQVELHIAGSSMISKYASNPEVIWEGPLPILKIPEQHELEIAFLKHVIWVYVISRAQLGTQQRGMKRIIKNLFKVYKLAIKEGDYRLVPGVFQHRLDQFRAENVDWTSPQIERAHIRLVVDIVASLSDQQAIVMNRRLSGDDPGTISDFIAS